MNKTTSLLLTLMLGFSLGAGALAGDDVKQRREDLRNASPEQRAQFMTDRMSESLGLSDSQRDQIGEVNLRYSQEMSTLRDLERDERRARMQDIRIRREGEVSALLNDDQQAQLEGFKANRKERGKKHYRHGENRRDVESEA